MGNPFLPRIGSVISADIAVPDHERVVSFYRNVLGTGERPLWRDDLNNNLGLPVVGVGPRLPEYEGLPLQWMPHIQVADVATAASRAVALGGHEAMHGKASDGSSQWAVLIDPDGAAFGIIPKVPAPADEVVQAVEAAKETAKEHIGRIAWFDLAVPNADAAREFYREVIGWGVQDVAMKDGDETYADYCMLAEDGEAAGGVCHARGTNADLPPVWMLYLPVGDIDASLRNVQANGGEVVKTSAGEDGSCSIAVLRDPVGAYVAITRA